MKKYITIILVTILAIFISNIPASAREMDLKELGESAIELKEDTEYIYVIGKYAFTSEYQLKQQDIMLAAGSIAADAKDLEAALEKMNIQKVVPKYDKKFKIIGWENGANLVGKTKLSTKDKFDIRYIDYTFFAEKSNATINLDIFNGDTYQTYTNILNEKLKFQASESYSGGKLTYKDGTLSGLLLKNDKITLKDEDKEKYQNTPYYFSYVLEVPNATDKTKITTSGMGRKGEIKWENFDIQKENGKTPGIVVLVPVIKTEWEKDKTYSITIDLDGETSADGKTGEEYEPTTYKLDLSGLTFQEDSTATLNDSEEEISETDKNTLKEWGYTLTGENKHYNLVTNGSENSYKLTGKVEEQYLKEGTFNSNAEDGYFFVFNLKKPDELTKVPDGVKVTVEGEQTLTYGKEYFNENGVFTEIFKLKNDCNNDCTIKVKVDWDGESGDKYLESKEITIDYKGLTFVKGSKFEVKSVDSTAETKLGQDFGWKKETGFETKFTTDGTTVKVTGLLPILDTFTGDKHPFDGGDITGYYLPFILETSSNRHNESSNKTTVQFIHEGEDPRIITAESFDGEKQLYILRHLDMSDQDRKFKIVVDMDGDGEEYVPYEITFDWSELKLQETSRGDFGNYSVIEEKDLTEQSQEKKDLESYGYNFDTNEVTVKTELQEETQHLAKKGLEGTVKEQELQSGFKTNTGYFVPIKIEFPGKGVEELANYTKTWTITLYTEDDKTKVYTPTEEEYNQGWVLVLFKVEKEGRQYPGSQTKEKKIRYQIDFDGPDKYEFIPEEYSIDYDSLNFAESHEVTFKGIEGVDLTVWDGDTITDEMLETISEPEVPQEQKDYREFAYWDNGKGESIVGTKVTTEMETIELIPHWNIYSDKFVSDVIEDLNNKISSSSDLQEKIVIEDYKPNSGEVTISVIDPTTTLSTIGETNIPGTIAYILLKDEIKTITLSVNGETKQFTKDNETDQENLKNTIKTGAKELYNGLLTEHFDGKTDETVTLSALANKEGFESFSLTINPEELPKTISLVETPAQNGISLASNITVPTTYTFTYDSNVEAVKNEEELKQALSRSASNIVITGDFQVTAPVNVSRSVNINSDSQKRKISAGEGVDSIFNIQSTGVTIENLELADASKNAITVESGYLTTNNLTITPKAGENSTFEAGIEVKNGGNLTASELTYDAESYDKPAVKAEKSNTTVNLTNKESKNADKITKEKITAYEDYKTTHEEYNLLTDKREEVADYNYYNYYNNPDVSKIYTTKITTHEAGFRIEVTRYNTYGEKLKIPTVGKVFSNLEYDGEKYEFIGYSESNEHTVIRSDEEKPESVIDKDNATVTSDKHYWVSFKVSIVDGAKRVSNEEEFKDALKNDSINSIYITEKITITLDDDSSINRNLTISSAPGKNAIIKAKKITISGNDTEVFFNRVNFEFTAEDNQDSLIETNGKKLTLWQTGIKNTGKPVKYALNYKNNSSIVDIRWNTINASGFSPENITDSYINVSGKLAAGTDVYGNTFKKGTEGPKSVMIINGFDSDTLITQEDHEPDIRFEANKYEGMDYALEFTTNASGGKADIVFANGSNQTQIGVHYNNEKNQNYSEIKLYKSNVSNVTQMYIGEDGQAQKDAPEGVTGITLVQEMVLP